VKTQTHMNKDEQDMRSEEEGEEGRKRRRREEEGQRHELERKRRKDEEEEWEKELLVNLVQRDVLKQVSDSEKAMLRRILVLARSVEKRVRCGGKA